MSIGNIKSTVRNKPSNNAWILIAYLPTSKFKDAGDYNGLLCDRLFHQALKIVLASLTDAGTDGREMTDSTGDVRLCFPRVAAYLADHPEQRLVNVTLSGWSPTTTADHDHLGDAEASPPRTREWILSRIQRILRSTDPNDLKKYKNLSKDMGLNGVHKPFWEELPGYEPSVCVPPDILHGIHRFWRDHILVWVINLIGFDELDRRLKLLQPVVNVRHFSNGIQCLTQWTGREDRELQRVLLAALNGSSAINEKAMRCLRAIHDFIYFAQYRSHSTTTLGYLSNALKTFHSLKDVFIQNKARKGDKGVIPHFNIPKLCALHSYATHIPQMGSSPQYSTEITENLHQTMAKAAYKATNRKDYAEQMARYLDRCDRILYMNEFLMWAKEETHRRMVEQALKGTSALYRQIATRHLNAAFDQELEVPLLRRRKGQQGRLWHTLTPHFRYMRLESLCEKYGHSPEPVINALRSFSEQALPGNLSAVRVDAWTHLRIKLPTIQEVGDEFQTRTVQALPPSRDLPSGRFHCVLVHETAQAKEVGILGQSSKEM
jgi:Plavaka transposase